MFFYIKAIFFEYLDSPSLPSVDRVHIYFPDPWHKKRHKKRRLIQKEFLSLLAEKMKAKGRIHLATDWEDYAEHIESCISDQQDFLTTEAFTDFSRPLTRYEERGLKLGHELYEFYLEKK